MSTDKQLIGAAGEHLVLSRLLARGMLAAQAPRGVRKVDILVNHLDERAPSLIQVKSSSKNVKTLSWPMNKKHEGITEEDLFFCFVNFNPLNPEVFVLPGITVSKVIAQGHANWLASPGKNGKEHQDTDMRLIANVNGWMDEYLERWDLIK